MAGRTTYSQEQIDKAKVLFNEGKLSLRKIANAVGFRSTQAVLYYCNERWKRKHLEKCMKIYHKNKKHG